jgi:hypothetical protein
MKHLVIPDVQIKPGDDTEFLTAIGRYITDKKPDVVVCLGDFADMPSLSSYDVGKKSFEGRRYASDISASRQGMDCLMAPLKQHNDLARKGHRERYYPRLEFLLGNHENRINRAVNDDAKLDGVLSVNDLQYAEAGWTVHNFLDVVVLDGVAYSHYFVTGVAGRPASSAALQLSKKHMSCIAGHQQGLQIATGSRADGKTLTSIIAGSCYEHDEDYLGPQGNKHWRGVLMLHNVNDGEFDLVQVPLHYLKEKYLAK